MQCLCVERRNKGIGHKKKFLSNSRLVDLRQQCKCVFLFSAQKRVIWAEGSGPSKFTGSVFVTFADGESAERVSHATLDEPIAMWGQCYDFLK
jgi:hypothetical protein